jgi:hypothetical protein
LNGDAAEPHTQRREGPWCEKPARSLRGLRENDRKVCVREVKGARPAYRRSYGRKMDEKLGEEEG